MSGRRNRRLIAAALVALFVVALVALLLDRQVEVEPSRSLIGHLQVVAPESVDAGDEFVVEVTDIVHGEVVEVWVDGGYGGRLFSGEVDNGIARVLIEPAQGPESGTLVVHAVAQDAVGSTVVEMVPGTAVDPLDLYLGPRTVIADGRDFSMIVAVPKDSFGNPVIDGTVVDYTVTRDDGSGPGASEPTSGLLSYHRIFSRTVATRTRVAATVGSANGPERSFLEVAGIPSRFDLGLVDAAPLADGHSLARIRTGELVDEFGNQLPDGSLVYLDAAGVTGVRRLRSVAIEGQAEFVFEAPAEPGEATFIATASGIASTPLEVSFPSAVAELPAKATLVVVEGADGPRNAVELRIGRVVSSRDSYVPDGTLVRVETADEVYEAPIEFGAATVTVSEISGVAEVSVLGTVITIDLGDAEPAS